MRVGASACLNQAPLSKPHIPSVPGNTSHGNCRAVYIRTRHHRMRTTLNIDDELLERAREITGEREKTALVRMGQASLEVALLVSQER